MLVLPTFVLNHKKGLGLTAPGLRLKKLLIQNRNIVKNQTFNKDKIHNNYYVWNS